MKIVLGFLSWVCLPLLLGAVFAVAPCYMFGSGGWEHVWCGFKNPPPHLLEQFLAGLATGLVIAFILSRRRSARQSGR
jgi:hypothetical protein